MAEIHSLPASQTAAPPHAPNNRFTTGASGDITKHAASISPAINASAALAPPTSSSTVPVSATRAAKPTCSSSASTSVRVPLPTPPIATRLPANTSSDPPTPPPEDAPPDAPEISPPASSFFVTSSNSPRTNTNNGSYAIATTASIVAPAPAGVVPACTSAASTSPAISCATFSDEPADPTVSSRIPCSPNAAAKRCPIRSYAPPAEPVAIRTRDGGAGSTNIHATANSPPASNNTGTQIFNASFQDDDDGNGGGGDGKDAERGVGVCDIPPS